MSVSASAGAGMSRGRLLHLLFLLWLAGVAMRMTILVMPPVIPLIHDELNMSETQVGLLIGLPLAIFALAAVPGSLFIARLGATSAVVLGAVITALAGGARAGASNIWMLYAATIVTGFGVAIIQPAAPTLVREWLPRHMALGTIAFTSGMLMGATFAPVLTIPFVLPLVGGSWRLDVLAWAVPALVIAPVFLLWSPKRGDRHIAETSIGGRWWPNWRNPLIWLLGFTFGSNNSSYFATNAFLPDYLAAQGQPELIGPALGWLNGAQLLAVILLIAAADHFHRRAWPYLIFGPLLLAAFVAMMFASGIGIIIAAAMVGFTTAITLTATLALPSVLSAPGDVPRNAAGMFTISYTCAVIVPTVSGALWDITGRPWTAFLPLCLCAIALTMIGWALTRYRPVHAAT